SSSGQEASRSLIVSFDASTACTSARISRILGWFRKLPKVMGAAALTSLALPSDESEDVAHPTVVSANGKATTARRKEKRMVGSVCPRDPADLEGHEEERGFLSSQEHTDNHTSLHFQNFAGYNEG